MGMGVAQLKTAWFEDIDSGFYLILVVTGKIFGKKKTQQNPPADGCREMGTCQLSEYFLPVPLAISCVINSID